MRIRLLPIIIATVIGLSAQANAAREHYLVGLRHVYMFDVWPDTHRLDRQAIEETFAAAVATGQQQYDTDMASIRDEESKDGGNIHQVDRDAVQQNLEQAIADAADQRDNSLSQLYVQCDYVRASHPEFQVDQDGPYQVMGCDVDQDGNFVDICYYRPYPMFLDPCPFGWDWGHAYPFVTFGLQVRLFHTTWLSIGAPVFAPMYHAGVKITVMAPVRLNVILNRASWAGGRPPSITEDDRKALAGSRDLQRKAGIRPPSAHPGMTRVRTISPPGAVSRYTRHSTTPPPSPGTSRYSRGPARTTTGGSGGKTTGSGSSRTHTSGGATGGSGSRGGDDHKHGG